MTKADKERVCASMLTLPALVARRDELRGVEDPCHEDMLELNELECQINFIARGYGIDNVDEFAARIEDNALALLSEIWEAD